MDFYVNTKDISIFERIDRFIYSKYFIICVGALTLLSNLFALELPVYALFTVVVIAVVVFGAVVVD